jgi:hypothetical protein
MESNGEGTPPSGGYEQGFWAEWRDSIGLRTTALIVGVLLLQFGFVLSYVGAFHTSRPHRIPIAIVAPSAISTKVVNGLNDIASAPLQATAVANQAAARQEVRNATTSAAFIVVPQSHVDRLIVANAGGTSVATAVVKIMTKVDASEKRAIAVTDLVPVQPGDGEGLTGFYLVIGWIVGGYLVAALLGIAAGSRPATPRRAAYRLMAVVPYAIVSGFGGALIVDQVLGALTGHFLALWWLGALLVATAATVTMAFQAFLGVIGIGVTVLVFMILGNPSAGGAFQPPLLPPFWRTIAYALPNGAGTDSVRRIVYLGANGIVGHLILISGYAVAGAIIAQAGSDLHRRRRLLGASSTAGPAEAISPTGEAG